MSKELRRKLHAASTSAERAFWRLIHPFRTGGYHFRKQVQIGDYYVDFACLHAQIVVEIDGDTHATELGRANDETRDHYLMGRGFTVLRFTNDDVWTNPDGVFQVVGVALERHPERHRSSPPPQPSPQGGGCDLGGVAPLGVGPC